MSKPLGFDPLLEQPIFHGHKLSEIADVNEDGKVSGSILKYDTTSGKWKVGVDNDTLFTAGTGLSLSGTQFSLDSSYVTNNLLKLNQSTPQTLTASPIFNNLTAGRIPFVSSTKTLTDSDRLFWDNTNKRLGIGTATPVSSLHVYGSSSTSVGTFSAGINLTLVSPPPKVTLQLVSEAGNVNAGTHYYYVTYYTAIGETDATTSPTVSVTTTAESGKVLVTIPRSSDPFVIGRKLYRTVANDYHWMPKLLDTIDNNTDETYLDNKADASLGNYGGFWRPNTTNKYIQVNGVNAMVLDSKNTIIGYGAGESLSGGGHSCFVGQYAGKGITTGEQNTCIGSDAGRWLSSASNNTLVGRSSGERITGNNNVAIGRNTALKVGACNVAIGMGALQLGGANNSVAIGYMAGYGVANNTSQHNVFLGFGSGCSITTCSYNTFLGYNSGYKVTSGSSNVLLGCKAGYNLTTESNRLYIANSDTSTPLIYGLFSGTGAGVTIYSQNTSGIPLVVRGIASQSSNLQEWQNSNGTTLASIDSSGAMSASAYKVGATNGIDKTITVLDADGSTTHALTFTKGILTACVTI